MSLHRRVAEERILESRAPLFSYQADIVQQLESLFESRDEGLAALVSLPTGGGKTRTGLWSYRELLKQEKLSKLLWVAPSGELVDQAAETLIDLWDSFPGAPRLQMVKNDIPSSRATNGAVGVLVTAQLAAKRASQIQRLNPDLLVFDEAHQAVARTFKKLVRDQLSRNGWALGLTATPGRVADDEGEDLTHLFQNRLITSQELGSSPVKTLRERGVLSKIVIKTIELAPQWDQIRVTSSSKRSLSLDELSLNPARFWATVDTVTSLKKQSRTLVFGASVAHCSALTGALRARGVRCAVVSHMTPAERRRSILAQFASADLDVLINKSILATGYDCPAVTDIVLSSPIRSSILWEQILGRASRGPAVGGTAKGQVWELDYHKELHSSVLSYARFIGELWA